MQEILEKMRRDWDLRARENAAHFIHTGQDAWTDEEFFRTGEINVADEVLTDMGNICRGRDPKRMRVLEIGCGAGRLTRALGRTFGEVHAVDISPEMIALAKEKLGGVPNIFLYANNGADVGMLPSNSFHFAFSYIVFQHIPNKEIIESYIRDVHRVLKAGALFKFQAQGEPALEREAEDTWLGVGLSEAEAREMAERCGFEMRYATGAGTQYLWLWFFKKSPWRVMRERLAGRLRRLRKLFRPPMNAD